MALTVTDEVEREARRIVGASNPFEVLEIAPRDCTKTSVQTQFETKVALFKRLFRNKLAMQAKTRLEDAKMRLSDPRLLAKEVELLNASRKTEATSREEIARLETRTRVLEQQASLISQTRV